MSSRKWEAVPGFFLQDDPTLTAADIEAIPPRLGLIDDSQNRWDKFKQTIKELNEHAEEGTSYKVFVFGRHGQGIHNVAGDKYGRDLWYGHWSKLERDDELVWGPDAPLTQLGKDQAKQVRAVWEAEIPFNIFLPESHYCSPMTRALQTCLITFDSISLTKNSKPPVILEDCREAYGLYTCDKRNTRSYISSEFPQFTIADDFTEEDELWEADTRESKESVSSRATRVLDRIFEKDGNTFISITAHKAIINGFLTAINRPTYDTQTGGIIPIVIKKQKTTQ
ncbi:phosphoglycerate mutase [Dendrothele bispora CBS 962.96]|uniref:Phosphoglycerate mutase n=1 Tax=Dendrothele bispora (strain CBS 962.96) TaxID=1314807 RepID=A0A4S8MDX1_DENBC|nr:phosphoglycerate mutase [Dendrothele bispora CBS 962.96]